MRVIVRRVMQILGSSDSRPDHVQQAIVAAALLTSTACDASRWYTDSERMTHEHNIIKTAMKADESFAR